jgi:dihydrofolate reductase
MFKMIVAMTHNRGIGFNNKLPWKLQKDMNYFKRQTTGEGNNCVIMGRKTWYSLESYQSESLPKRAKIIMSTKNIDINTTNSNLANNLQDVIDICYKYNYDERWVIGGEQIYKTFINAGLVSEIYVTQINRDYLCDTYFPPIPNNFKLHSNTDRMWEKGNSFRFKCYQKENM